MKKQLILLFFITCLLSFIPPVYGATWHVDANNSSAQDGASWTSAFTTIQSGIDAASSGDEIWVAAGSYAEAITMKSDISLYGGFNGSESARSERNVLDNITVINAGGNAFHVVTMVSVSNAVIDGFTITGGYSASDAYLENRGLGIYCAEGADNTISNCIITDNKYVAPATYPQARGVGLFNSSDNLMVENCIFTGNSWAYYGSGMYTYAPATIIRNCTFLGNHGRFGGGLYVYRYAAEVSNCSFVNNAATDIDVANGGGVYFANPQGGSVLSNNTFLSNSSRTYGGGLYFDSASDVTIAPAIINCVFYGNTSENGGGIAMDDHPFSSIINTIFTNNSNYAILGIYDEGDASSPAVIKNCLFNNNTEGVYYESIGYGENILSYTDANDINMNLNTALNNFSEDPFFVPGVTGTWTAEPNYDNWDLQKRIILTDSNASFIPGALVGRLIQSSIESDSYDIITANDATTIEIVSLSAAEIGLTYKLVDFHLLDGSRALDNGDISAAPIADFENDPRPGTDNKVDIGVDEADSAYTPSLIETIEPIALISLVPAASGNTTFEIHYVASDAQTGMHHVQLYYRLNDGSWNLYEQEGISAFTGSPISFDTSLTGGDGQYEFYLLATDNAGNIETADNTPEAEIMVMSSFGGTRLYVNKDATGIESGADWTNGLRSISVASIFARDLAIPEIWVAQGTYNELIKLPSGVSIYGSFAKTETTITDRNLQANPTILDGRAYDYPVLMEDITDSRINGFVISGGLIGGIYGKDMDDSNSIEFCHITSSGIYSSGLGLHLEKSSPAVNGTTISGNNGTGIYANDSSSPVITNSIISGNTRHGILIELAASPSLINCTISINGSNGINCDSDSNFTLINSIIYNNRYGEIFLNRTTTYNPLTMINSSLFYPSEGHYIFQFSSYWTGIFDAETLNQQSFAQDNIDGPPVFMMGASGTWTEDPVYDTNTGLTTLTDSQATFSIGKLKGSSISTNCDLNYVNECLPHYLIVANTATSIQILGDPGNYTISGCNYQIIDFHLQDNSPAIDTGTDSSAPNSDKDFKPRPVDIMGLGVDGSGTEYDMGAYELQFRTMKELIITPESDFITSGGINGPFTPSSQIYTMENTSALPIDWQAESDENWLGITPISGTIAPGVSSELTIAINSDATPFSEMPYSGTVTITDITHDASVERYASLQVLLDYLTEVFESNDNEPDNQTLLFIPENTDNFYQAFRMPGVAMPIDPGLGTQITPDEGTKLTCIRLADSKTFSFYGIRYNTICVGFKGYIRFTNSDNLIDTTTLPTLANHFAAPRISGLFTDLDYTVQGSVSYQQLDDRIVVSFDNIAEQNTTNSNSFQIQMFFNNSIRIIHLGIDASDSIVGLSRGGGIPANFIQSDLSSYTAPSHLSNLFISSVTTQDIGFTRQTTDIQWTTGNNGVAAIGDWQDCVYMSDDNQPGNDILLGCLDRPAELENNEEYTRILTATIPENTTGGEYWFLVKSDDPNRLLEQNEGDNFFLSDPIQISEEPAPNLQVTQISIPETDLTLGDSLSLDWVVKNSGNAPTNASYWRDSIYLSVDQILDSLDVDVGSFTNPLYLNAEEEYSNSGVVTITGVNDGQYYLLLKTDSKDEVDEYKNENDNVMVGELLNISFPPPPDLVVESVQAPDQAFSGQTMQITYSVANIGPGELPLGTYDETIYLSEDATLNPGEDILLRRIYRSISNIGTYTETVSLPEGMSGQFYVFVTTDSLNRINEFSFEANNSTYDTGSLNLILTPPPDLEIDEMHIISAQPVRAGQPFTLSYTAANNGSASPPDTRWQDAFYLSEDGQLDTQTDILLMTRTGYFPDSLAVGASYTNEISLKTSAGLEGNFYLFVVVDQPDDVFELNNENNIKQIPISVENIAADLIATSIGSDDIIVPGTSLSLNWSVQNQGSGDTLAGVWSDYIYGSPNDIPGDADDIYLGLSQHIGLLNPGESYTATKTVFIPYSFSGDYNLFVIADKNAIVYEEEQTRANNTSSFYPFTVSNEVADLSALTASTQPENGKLRIQWQAENSGSNTTSKNYWYDAIIFSINDIFGDGDDFQIAANYHSGSLDPGDQYNENELFGLPLNLDGVYHVFINIDKNNTILETDPSGNNHVYAGTFDAADVQSSPDLVVHSISHADTVVSGQSLQVDWEGRNIGTFMVKYEPYRPEYRTGRWIDRVYLSKDRYLDTQSDIFLGEETNATISLIDVTDDGTPYQRYTRRTYVTIPKGLTGSYFILVAVDRSGMVIEPDGEDNNIGVATESLSVDLPSLTDLTVSNIVIPETAMVNTAVSISYDIENLGNYDISGYPEEKFFFSTDAFYSSDDIPMGQRRTSSIVPQRFVQGSNTINFSLPIKGIPQGSYYLIVRADARNSFPETNENNNQAASLTTIQIIFPTIENSAGPGDFLVDCKLHANTSSYRFQFDAAAGDTISFDAQWLATTGSRSTVSSLYLAHQREASPEDYDFSEEQFLVSTETEGHSQPLSVTIPANGTYYLRLDVADQLEEQLLSGYNFPSEGRHERFNLLITPDTIDLSRLSSKVLEDLNTSYEPNYYLGHYSYIGGEKFLSYSYEAKEGETLALEAQWFFIEQQDTACKVTRMTVNNIYVGYEYLPTLFSYDYAQQVPLTATLNNLETENSRLIIPQTKSGTYFILLHIKDPRDNFFDRCLPYTITEHFDLVVTKLPFIMSSIHPTTTGNQGTTTFDITASEFNGCTDVQLLQNGQLVQEPERISFAENNDSRGFATFDMTGLQPGEYQINVKAQNGESAAMPITVVQGFGGRIGANISGPGSIREDRDYIYYVNYGNGGGNDAIAPLLVLQNTGDHAFALTRSELHKDQVEPGQSIQVLGVSHEGAAGMLRPGEIDSIPVFFYSSWGGAYFDLYTYTANDPTPFNFEAIEDQVRPDDVTNEDWQQIRPNLINIIGPTWGHYVRALADAATYLAEKGIHTDNVAELFDVIYHQALYPRTISLNVAISDASGCFPIAEARVSAFDAEETLMDSCVSSTLGKCGLELPAGSYLLRVAADGFAQKMVETVEVLPGEIRLESIRLFPESTITGNIVLSSQEPTDVETLITACPENSLASECFSLSDKDISSFTISELPEGLYTSSFTISELPEGLYTVSVHKTGFLEWSDTIQLADQASIDLGDIILVKEGSISGTITGTALLEAKDIPVRATALGETISADISNEAGQFQITGLMPGTYTLGLQLDSGYSIQQEISLSEGEQLTGVNFQLYDGATISGTLLDPATSLPLAFVPVQLTGPDGISYSTITDADGNYSFTGLVPGQYSLSIPTSGIQQDVDIQDFFDNPIVDLESTFIATLSGHTRLPDGTPIPYTVVDLSMDGHAIISTYADKDGLFTFLLLQEGDYELMATSNQAGFLPVTDITVTEGSVVEQDLIAIGNSTLSVALENSLGEPVDTASVTLYRKIAGNLIIVASNSDDSLEDTLFTNLVPGEYLVAAISAVGEYGEIKIQIEQESDVILPITLGQTISFTGSIKDTSGLPVSGAWLVLQSASKPDFQRVSVSVDDGNYTFPALPADVYNLLVTAPGFTPFEQTTINAGVTGQLAIILDKSTTEIRGRVLDDQSVPLAEVSVAIVDVQNRPVQGGLTDSEGYFSFDSASGRGLKLFVHLNGYLEQRFEIGDVNSGDSVELEEIVLLPYANIQLSLEFLEEPEEQSIARTSMFLNPGDLWREDSEQDPEKNFLHQERSEVPMPDSCDLQHCREEFNTLYYRLIPRQDQLWRWIESWERGIDSQGWTVAAAFTGELMTQASFVADTILITKSLAQSVAKLLRNFTKLPASQMTTLLNDPLEIFKLLHKLSGIGASLYKAADIIIKVSTASTAAEAQHSAKELQGLQNDLQGLLGSFKSELEERFVLIGRVGSTASNIAGFAGNIVSIVGWQQKLEDIFRAMTYEQTNAAIDEFIRLTDGQRELVIEYNALFTNNNTDPYRGRILYDGCREGHDDCGDDSDENRDSNNPPDPSDPSDDGPGRSWPGDPGQDPYNPDLVLSYDPNDIIGPAGFADEHWISAKEPLPYMIRFENMAEATASAQRVTITQQLDDNFDFRTFKLKAMGWGDTLIVLEQNPSFYQGRHELDDGSGNIVEITAYVDVLTGIISWNFQTIDPLTGDVPEDAFAGFLPPNNDEGIGEGFVSYSIQASNESVTGDVIDAEARIVFDTNEPIDTPAIFNTIDIAPPASSVTSAEQGESETEQLISWSGEDDGGSALKDFSIFVSKDKAPYIPWLTDTTLKQALFTAKMDHTYDFYSLSRDNAGNIETAPIEPDVSIVIGNPDQDGDGMLNSQEEKLGTDPLDSDTDDDGIADGDEDINHNGVVDYGETSPLLTDSDNDGLQDGTELGKTDPLLPVDGHSATDTDIFMGDSDPLTVTLPLNPDSDGDQLLDGEEDSNKNGRVDLGETDPLKTDTDNDGISDDKDNCPDTQADNIVDANGCAIIKGDMNRDGDVDIKDSQLGLKVITLQKPMVDPLIDADGDGKIGLKDTIYTIQRAREKIEDPEE